MKETLLEIAEWVSVKSAPNEHRKYSRCPICRNAWWDKEERHNLDCFVPRLQNAAELAQQQLTQQDSEPSKILQHLENAKKLCAEGLSECAISTIDKAAKLLPY